MTCLVDLDSIELAHRLALDALALLMIDIQVFDSIRGVNECRCEEVRQFVVSEVQDL